MTAVPLWPSWKPRCAPLRSSTVYSKPVKIRFIYIRSFFFSLVLLFRAATTARVAVDGRKENVIITIIMSIPIASASRTYACIRRIVALSSYCIENFVLPLAQYITYVMFTPQSSVTRSARSAHDATRPTSTVYAHVSYEVVLVVVVVVVCARSSAVYKYINILKL